MHSKIYLSGVKPLGCWFNHSVAHPTIVLAIFLLSLAASFASASDPAIVHRQYDESPALILFGGDTYFGEHYFERVARGGESNLLLEKGYNYCLQNLSPLMRTSDIVVLNLETPIIKDERITPNRKSQAGYPLHTGASPATEDALRALGTTAVSIANNHAMDFGDKGLSQTMASLDSVGIHHFGAGVNSMEASQPLHLRFENAHGTQDVFIVAGYAYRRPYEEEFEFYASPQKPGVWLLEDRATSNQIQGIREVFPKALIIAFPHWGWNWLWKNQNQIRLAHAMIDAGADLVLGHGAHHVQEIDSHKGRWIIYSLGNFLFNTECCHKKYDSPPFSFVARLLIDELGASPRVVLRLYPIVSDNTIVRFQPRPIHMGELGQMHSIADWPIPIDLDEFGFYFQTDVWPTSALAVRSRPPGHERSRGIPALPVTLR